MTRIYLRPALALALLLVGPGLFAGTEPAAAQGEEEPPRVELRFRTQGAVFENLFRVRPDSLEQTIYAASADARVSVRPDRSLPLQLHAEGRYIRYESLGESPELAGAVSWNGRPHRARLRLSHQDDRPAFDLGEVVRTADITHLVGSYGHRISEDWEAGVEGQFARVQFDSVPANDSDLYTVGGRLRYRGFGYQFSPEITASYGRRVADDPRLESDRVRLAARIVSIPTPGVWISARYRHRDRGYVTTDPASANFGRSDTGRQWTLAVAYALSDHFELTLYADRLAMDSSRPDRTFTTSLAQLGLTVTP